jgi:hypothetical protein
VILTEEKPTPSDGGASIEDRLVKYLAAEETPAPQPKAEVQDAPEPETQAATQEPDKPDSDAPDEGSQPQLTTSDLAKVLGIDEEALIVNDDGSISVKSKIDGKEVAPKFADLIKSYQVQGHADNKAREVAEREKALQARQQEVEQAFQQRLSHVESLAQLAKGKLTQRFQSVDWATLRQNDPGQYAALMTDFQRENAEIDQALQQANGYRQQQQQQAQTQKAERLAKEAEKLPTLIPEWKDSGTAAKESKELIDWGLSIGYPIESMRALHESSALDVATFRKAMLYDKLQTSKAVVENKVRTAPKIVKPGQSAQVDAKTENLRNLKAQVSKTGGKNGSLEAYLLAAGKV